MTTNIDIWETLNLIVKKFNFLEGVSISGSFARGELLCAEGKMLSDIDICFMVKGMSALKRFLIERKIIRLMKKLHPYFKFSISVIEEKDMFKPTFFMLDLIRNGLFFHKRLNKQTLYYTINFSYDILILELIRLTINRFYKILTYYLAASYSNRCYSVLSYNILLNYILILIDKRIWAEYKVYNPSIICKIKTDKKLKNINLKIIRLHLGFHYNCIEIKSLLRYYIDLIEKNKYNFKKFRILTTKIYITLLKEYLKMNRKINYPKDWNFSLTRFIRKLFRSFFVDKNPFSILLSLRLALKYKILSLSDLVNRFPLIAIQNPIALYYIVKNIIVQW